MESSCFFIVPLYASKERKGANSRTNLPPLPSLIVCVTAASSTPPLSSVSMRWRMTARMEHVAIGLMCKGREGRGGGRLRQSTTAPHPPSIAAHAPPPLGCWGTSHRVTSGKKIRFLSPLPPSHLNAAAVDNLPSSPPLAASLAHPRHLQTAALPDAIGVDAHEQADAAARLPTFLLDVNVTSLLFDSQVAATNYSLTYGDGESAAWVQGGCEP